MVMVLFFHSALNTLFSPFFFLFRDRDRDREKEERNEAMMLLGPRFQVPKREWAPPHIVSNLQTCEENLQVWLLMLWRSSPDPKPTY